MFVLDTERLTWSQPQTKVGLNLVHLFVLLEYLNCFGRQYVYV